MVYYHLTIALSMKKLIRLAMILGFFWVDGGTVFAATLHVPSSEYLTIQAAIDAAVREDTVQVAAGTYTERITMKSGVIIRGAGAGDNPLIHSIIDGGGTGTVVTAEDVDSTARLEGFKITNGSGNSSGGMFIYTSSPTVINCIFSDNSSGFHGGGMKIMSSSPLVFNCTFTHNAAYGHGGGIFSQYSSPIITNCTFSGNVAGGGGGGIFIDTDSNSRLTNCTFSRNRAVQGGGIGIWSSTPTAINCIVWGNSADTWPEIDGESMIVTYSNVRGGYGGTGNHNIDSDPLFANALAGDFHLLKDSPCIDAGFNSALSIPVSDFEGDDRIMDGNGDGTATVDMGSDEYIYISAGRFYSIKTQDGKAAVIYLGD